MRDKPDFSLQICLRKAEQRKDRRVDEYDVANSGDALV